MTILVRIANLAFGGAFVGEVVSPGENNGKRAFIRGTCPGELVEAEIIKEEKRFVQAKLLKVLEQSAERINPECPLYGECGGCDLQHLSIFAQREAKRDMIETHLKFQAGVTPLHGVKIAERELPAYGYRRRALLHLSKEGKLGFFRSESRDTIDIESCPILTPALNEKLSELRLSRFELAEKNAGIIIEEQDCEVGIAFKRRNQRHHDDEGTIGHFSQINAAGNSLLIDIVLDYASGSKITDLYAGSGNFSFPLVSKGLFVEAVELDSVLVEAGKKLAQDRNLNVVFTQSSCEKYVRNNKLNQTVLLDPPRSGAKEVVRHFDPNNTSRIIYVSCSLPTLARDCKILCEKGYNLIEVQFVDMFPQTHHAEMVALFNRTSSNK